MELKTLFLDTLPSWGNLVSQAKTQNKFIYLYCSSSNDCCTGNTYETEFFPTTIKDYLRNNFILINLQVDYNAENEFICTKADTHFLDSLKKNQNISGRSIHLIFDKKGKLLTKFLFSFPDTVVRINYLKEILTGNNQYYTLLKKFKKGNRHPEFIRSFYKTYEGAISYANEDTIAIFQDFIKAYPRKKLFNKANGELIYDYSTMLDDECARNLFLNKDEWYKILGKKKVDEKIVELLCQDFEMTALIENNYEDKTKSFEKTKEAYLKSRIAYKDYNDIVFSQSLKKLLGN